MSEIDEDLPVDVAEPGAWPAAGKTSRRRRRAATCSVAAVVMVAAGFYLHAAQGPNRQQLGQIQQDLDYVARVTEGHVLYTPEPWVNDPTTYPRFTTMAPEGGVTSSGYLDGKWLIVSQFDADALTAVDKDVSTTPETLCTLTGPAGRDSSFKALSGTTVKIQTVCLPVPGHQARVRVILYLGDGDAMVDLAADLPEDGRVLNAGYYEKSRASVDGLVADPTGWADGVLDSLTMFDPSQYSSEDIYSAERDAGRFD